MTNSPTPDRDPNLEPTPSVRRRFRRLRRIALPVGLGLLAGLGGAAWWGWMFVNEQLAPLVADSLTKTLSRPVQVGEVERFSLTSLRFGSSSLPPTATDPDRATVEAIAVGFNPLQVLLTRKLKLDVTLVKPEIYLEQEKQGWIGTKIREQEEGFIELETIRVRDGNAVLLPIGTVRGQRSPITLSQVNGKADIFDKSKRFAYELKGQSKTGGDLQLRGETRLPAQDTNLSIRAKNLLVADIDRLVNLPFDLPTGRASGNITVQLRPNIEQPLINGTAQFEGVTLTIPKLPQSFTQARGGLRFQGIEIRLEDVNAVYGKVPLVANGTVVQDKGFNITAKVKPVSLPAVLQTLKVALPFSVTGQVQSDLKLTGPIAKPVLSGIARSTKPGTIDRVDLSRYNAAFKLDTAAEEVVIQGLQAFPTTGGQVTGSGRFDLGATDAAGKPRTQIALNLLATNVPGDAIARVYNDGNPFPVDIRRVDAQAQISGSADNVRTFVRWRAPQATYPGSGEILVANGVTTLRNTLFSIAGGTVGAEAVAANGRWQAVVTGSGIPLKQFSADLRGLFSGKFNASGSLDSFKPSDIRAQGEVRFSEGISLLKRPLTAQVRWNGQQILVQQATAPGFSADGAIALDWKAPQQSPGWI
ncbi:MAG: DUF748 domain-containing protein [Leptolyngbyaceae cyanobacterium RU_5_1]|nr:DUF748 domain-containing protein [Leptolyngbyaceae cyanobacterium RU_5_1]